VQREEPGWVRYAQRDPQQAKLLLSQHANRLRGVAPLAEAQRVAVVPMQLPMFEQSRAARDASKAERSLLAEFVRREQYDQGLASALVERAPSSLVVAAQMLQEIRWDDAGDLERAKRLQRWLERTTKCDDVRLFVGSRATPAEIEAVNRDLGTLWLWFVNEFAHTPRTWQAFRRLMR
jgi:hypothetical protein